MTDGRKQHHFITAGTYLKRFGKTLQRGDVINLDGTWVVIIEEAGDTSTVPIGSYIEIDGEKVHEDRLCEPRYCELGPSGRMTHFASYCLIKKMRHFKVFERIDLDVSPWERGTPKQVSV